MEKGRTLGRLRDISAGASSLAGFGGFLSLVWGGYEWWGYAFSFCLVCEGVTEGEWCVECICITDRSINHLAAHFIVSICMYVCMSVFFSSSRLLVRVFFMCFLVLDGLFALFKQKFSSSYVFVFISHIFMFHLLWLAPYFFVIVWAWRKGGRGRAEDAGTCVLLVLRMSIYVCFCPFLQKVFVFVLIV